MGESAGAMAVGNFINTYSDNPPFRAGILQSGSSVVKVPPGTLNNDITVWTSLVEHLNCSDTSDSGILACVRAMPARTLMDIVEENSILFGDAVADNFTVLEYPGTAWATGNVAKVPILIGSTADDGSVFTLTAGDNVTAFIDGAFGAGTFESNYQPTLCPGYSRDRWPHHRPTDNLADRDRRHVSLHQRLRGQSHLVAASCACMAICV